MDTIRTCFRRTRWINDERSWGIHIMDEGKTVIGPPPQEGFEHGAEYILAGKWVDNERYGRQFEYTSITLAEPVTADGVRAYLKKTCDGIGPAIAQRLWDKYGVEAVTMLRTQPALVSTQIPGISLTKANAAAESLNAIVGLEATNIQLSSLLDGYGFRRSVYNDVLKLWGVDAARRIRRDPFCLLTHRIPTAGFRRVDKLYCDLFKADPTRLNSLKRHAMCGWWTIKNDSSGNTWYNISRIEQALKEIGARDYNLPAVVDLLSRAKWLNVRQNQFGVTMVTDSGRANTEHFVARMIVDRMLIPCEPIHIPQGKLTEHQYEQIQNTFSGGLGILSGTPGTGKTFSTAHAVQYLLTNDYMVRVCAPTGKAAVRCTAAMQTCGVPEVATTIHTLLEPRFVGGRMSFTRNAENPIDADVVIVDEASMLDTPLFCALLSALRLDTRLVLVGDPYQLPPVGWGQPLNDLIKQAKVGIGELTEIHRNSGAIVWGCQAIKNGKLPTFADKFEPGDPTKNLVFIRESGKIQIANKVKAAVDKLVKNYGYTIKDIQVIVPTNGTEDVGRSDLNGALQGFFNANGQTAEKNRFRVGDKAIVLKNRLVAGLNGYCHPDEVESWDEIYVANGDTGVVLSVSPRHTFIHLTDPDRTIRVGPASVAVKKQSDGGDRLAEPKDGEGSGSVDVDLAYAITGHKSQGSGYKVVVIVLDPSFGALNVASRQWLYTGTSRAMQLAIWVGDEATARKYIGKVCNNRTSFLAEDIDALLENCNGTPEENRMEMPVCDLD